MVTLPKIDIGEKDGVIFIQGGMGAGVSLSELAGAVAKRGGVGTVSSVALDRMVSNRIGRKVDHRAAARLEIERAREISGGRGAIALNCMVLIEKIYRESIEGALEGGVDIIIAGAGLPLTLPEIVGKAEALLIPIVSSAKALRIICKRWADRQGRRPDAAILEGPLAGGHLGFSMENVQKPEYQLEHLFASVKSVAREYGDFPIIVAGGIYTYADIVRWAQAGADGVQLGTRFAATHESGASPEFKQAILDASPNDIGVAVNPGSPSGLPFRILLSSPGYVQARAHGRPLLCDKQYLLRRGADGRPTCRALEGYDSFCICNALLSAVDQNDTPDLPIFTVGANAWRVDRLLSVDELMDELTTAPVQRPAEI